MDLLFVCLGNICRSPAAEGIMKKKIAMRGLAGRINVDSAGTYGGHAGELPDLRMRKAAAVRGYDLHHRSRKLLSQDLHRFDKIIVMDDSNYEDTLRIFNVLDSDKLVKMTDFAQHFPDRFVPDPYYQGPEGFEYVLDLLENACEGLLDELTG